MKSCTGVLIFIIAFAVTTTTPVNAADLLLLEFENGSDLTVDSSASSLTGAIGQVNDFGTITQSSDVPSVSSGTGSALFTPDNFENGKYIEFTGLNFPNLSITDDFSLSYWVKPSANYINDTQGFRGMFSSLTEDASSAFEWQIDNGATIDPNSAGDPNALTETRIFAQNAGNADLIPDATLDPNQWTQISISFVAASRSALIFTRSESTSLAFSASSIGGDSGGFAMEELLVGANRGRTRVYEGLLDEVRVTDTAVIHDGVGGEFEPGDVNFSGGSPDPNDWLDFRAGIGADLSALSALGAYGMGDLDFDGDNDLRDFLAFKTLFNEANGAGSLEALIASVPEPSAAVLGLLAAGGFCFRRSRSLRPRHQGNETPKLPTEKAHTMRICCSLLMLLGCFLALSQTASAQLINFDFGNGTVDGTTGVAANFVITDEAPLGALMNTQGGVQMTLTGITTDPGGGVYDSNTQGFGIRSADDPNDPGENANSERRLDTTGDGETIQFSFDTDVSLISTRIGSMASTDEGFMISFVSGTDPFAGGNFSYMTTDDGATEGPTFDIQLGNIDVSAGTVLEFSTFNEGGGGLLWNDLNVFVGTPPAPEVPLKLQVNVFSGELSLVNENDPNGSVGDINIDYLNISSAGTELNGGSLVPGSYTGLAGAPGFPAGSNDGTGWELADSSDDLQIVELFLTDPNGSAIPADSTPIPLGNAFAIGGAQDLSFTYHIAGTGLGGETGDVEYLAPGDFDNDGKVDGVDFLIWQTGGSPDPLSQSDLADWEANYGSTAVITAATSAVPEPGTAVLLIAALFVAQGSRIRQCRS